eukprot:397869_1
MSSFLRSLLWFIHILNTRISRSSEICSVDFYGALFCDQKITHININTPSPIIDNYVGYNVLNASHDSRVFMIRWGYILDPDSKYSINNNVIIESFMNDYGAYSKPDSQFIINKWKIDGQTIPNNIFPESDSYESCQTIYLSKNDYIRKVSYHTNNESALIGLKFTTSTSNSYICPPEHVDNDWDEIITGSNRYYMLNGFEFKILGNEQIILGTNGGDRKYVKNAISVGFESISFGNACNPPCYDTNGNQRNYNPDYFTFSNDTNKEFLIYNPNHKMNFDAASNVCSLIESSLITLHSFNKFAVSFLDYNIWVGTNRANFWVDDTPILIPSISSEIDIDTSSEGCGYFSSNETIEYGNCSESKAFYCNNPTAQYERINLWVRSCDGWQLENHIDGQMQIIFKAELFVSQFIVVNSNNYLPSDNSNSSNINEYDKWMLYELYTDVIPTGSNISEYGKLIQFQIQMDVLQKNLWNFFDISDISFCLSGIVLQFGDNIYSRTASINGGVI